MAVDLPREVALKILFDIEEKGAYSNLSINKYFDDNHLNDLDKSFITELVYGTMKWRLSIDWIIQQFSSIKLKKISPWILNTMRMGVYQLLYIDKIPESAACNESVKLAKRYGHQASSRFVNGVLRNISRNRQSIKYPDKTVEYEKYLTVKYSHPEWMVKEWLGRFGRDFTEGLLKANNEVPNFTVRVNSLKVTKEQLMNKLSEEGIESEAGIYAEDALIIKNPSSITRLQSFKEGHFQVQDESSMLVGKILDPKPGGYVIDVCSAPGGKATHLAQLMMDKGTVIARDIHEHKINIIKNAVNRLGLTNVKAELFDATSVDKNSLRKADSVLVDAPCTGFGILRRKPDIKWVRNLADKSEITGLQWKILTAAAEYVKPGGELVYSTCTIESEENEDIVESFLQEYSDFEPVDLKPLLPIALWRDSAEKGRIQLFPNTDHTDGFFIAKLKRRG